MSQIMIIGSTAIKYWFPSFPREPKDIDYLVVDKSLYTNIPGKEEYMENPHILKSEYFENEYLKPDIIYTLKISHVIGWDINWMKHMWDIQFLKEMGCKINMELFHQLYNYWKEIHGDNKRSDLDMSSDDFFNNAIKYPIPHDDIHKIINPSPTFLKVLKDGSEVDVSEDKFNNLTFDEKHDLVYEEVAVMAAERFSKLDYRAGYSKMLTKFILYHAPIWEAIFIIENHKLLHKPKNNYLKIIEDELSRTYY